MAELQANFGKYDWHDKQRIISYWNIGNFKGQYFGDTIPDIVDQFVKLYQSKKYDLAVFKASEENNKLVPNIRPLDEIELQMLASLFELRCSKKSLSCVVETEECLESKVD